MKKLLSINELLDLSNSIVQSVGDDFDLDEITVCFSVSESDLDKINEELFYRTRKDETEKIKKANIVKAKINKVNFEFKPD